MHGLIAVFLALWRRAAGRLPKGCAAAIVAVLCQGFLPSVGAAQQPGDGLLGAFGIAQIAKGRELAAHERLQERIAASGGRPNIFTSDGCSGGLSAAWKNLAGFWPEFAQRHQDHPPFEGCCVSHDRAYHNIRGAPSALLSYEARLKADQQLQRCVMSMALYQQQDLEQLYGLAPDAVARIYEHLSNLMYYAVRFGGGPCSGQPWRWGYGYPDC